MFMLFQASAPFWWDAQIMAMLLDIFGSPALLGVFSIFFIFMLGLAFRLTLEIQLLVMLFFIMLFVVPMISWLPVALFLLVGMGLGAYLIYAIFNK